MTTTTAADVSVGQVWKDNDKRCPNRYLKVVRIIGDINPYWRGYVEMQQVEKVNALSGWMFTVGSRPRRIRIDRLRPGSNGYTITQEAK